MLDPKLKIETWPIDKMINYARNARLHSEDQVKAIAASIKEFGFINPCLVDPDGVLIAGHGRVMACRSLGIDKVPVIKLGHLTENQIKALRIADNALPAAASWSTELLRAELLELKAADYPIELLGFDDVQLVSFMAMPSGEDPERTPEPPAVPVSRLGDLWVMGKHRILCGDATKQEDVARIMSDRKLDLIFTDPPYNVAYSGRGQNKLGTIENDDQTDEAFQRWIDEVFARMANVMRSNACIYVCHPDSASAPKLAFENAFAAHFQKSSTIIWVKQAAGMGWQDYRAQHEPILYGWKSGKGKHFYSGDRAKTTVWPLDRDSQIEYVHPTQKPVVLSLEAINNSSRPGWAVGDFFAGSGSCLMACEQSNRQFFGMEIDARFCDIIVNRWQAFAKGEAILDGDGRTFAAIAKERAKKKASRKAPEASKKKLAGQEAVPQ